MSNSGTRLIVHPVESPDAVVRVFMFKEGEVTPLRFGPNVHKQYRQSLESVPSSGELAKELWTHCLGLRGELFHLLVQRKDFDQTSRFLPATPAGPVVIDAEAVALWAVEQLSQWSPGKRIQPMPATESWKWPDLRSIQMNAATLQIVLSDVATTDAWLRLRAAGAEVRFRRNLVPESLTPNQLIKSLRIKVPDVPALFIESGRPEATNKYQGYRHQSFWFRPENAVHHALGWVQPSGFRYEKLERKMMAHLSERANWTKVRSSGDYPELEECIVDLQPYAKAMGVDVGRSQAATDSTLSQQAPTENAALPSSRTRHFGPSIRRPRSPGNHSDTLS